MADVLHPDHYRSRERAQALADRIAEYWRERGGIVATRVESTTTGPEKLHWVRSDLLNGAPRKRVHQEEGNGKRS